MTATPGKDSSEGAKPQEGPAGAGQRMTGAGHSNDRPSSPGGAAAGRQEQQRHEGEEGTAAAAGGTSDGSGSGEGERDAARDDEPAGAAAAAAATASGTTRNREDEEPPSQPPAGTPGKAGEDEPSPDDGGDDEIPKSNEGEPDEVPEKSGNEGGGEPPSPSSAQEEKKTKKFPSKESPPAVAADADAEDGASGEEEEGASKEGGKASARENRSVDREDDDDKPSSPERGGGASSPGIPDHIHVKTGGDSGSDDDDEDGDGGGRGRSPARRKQGSFRSPPPPPPTSPRSYSKKLRKAPADLDEATFRRVRDYLVERGGVKELHSPLDDDVVVAFMIRLYHVSSRQAEYQHHLHTAGRLDDDDDLLGPLGGVAGGGNVLRGEARLFYDILADEQEHALGHELFKSMIANIKQEAQLPPPAAAAAKGKSPKSSPKSPSASVQDLSLDSRTLNWIKKAAGMNRSSASQARRNALQQAKREAAAAAAAAAERSEAAARIGDRKMVSMKTRTAARQSRVQKRQRGLQLLTDALDDIEKDFGPFERVTKKRKKEQQQQPSPPPSTKPAAKEEAPKGARQHEQPERRSDDQPSGKKKRPAPAAAADDDVLSLSGKSSMNMLGNSKLPCLVATIRRKHWAPERGNWVESTKDIVVSGMIINGKQKMRKRDKSHLALLKRPGPGRPKTKDKRAAQHKRKAATKRVEPAPTSRSVCWERSTIYRGGDAATVEQAVDVDYLRSVDEQLPPKHKQAGLTCRVPTWSAINHAVSRGKTAPTSSPAHPRRRHSDAVCSRLISKLMKVINGPARSWATCEFFYSDLDREWYSRNKFVEEMAKLGINPDVRLTDREWRAVRRRIAKKPRRFSKRFIASQLSERNAYRCRVRMLQHVPALASTASFPYNVPAPIRVGTTVTAFSRKFRLIQRGVVLSRDDLNARYLILFESEEFGCEYCPDSEVASHGGPVMLKVLGAQKYVSSAYNHSSREESSVSDTLWSRYCPLSGGDHGQEKFTSVRNEVEKALQFSPLSYRNSSNAGGSDTTGNREPSKDSLESLRNEAAEREMLVLLLKVSDAAARRKEALLTAVEKVSAKLDEYRNLTAVGRSGLLQVDRIRRLAEFKDHYVWLRANLEETSRTLNTALGYIKFMYGKARLPSRLADRQLSKADLLGDGAITSVLSEENPLPEEAYEWATELAYGAEDVSDHLVTAIASESIEKKKDYASDRSEVMLDRLRAVGQLLFAATCGQGIAAAPSGHDHVPPVAALAPGANTLFDMPEVPAANVDAVDLHAEVTTARDLAVADLKDALNLFHTELAVSNARHKLHDKK